MNDLYTERQALKEYIEYIQQERRTLAQEYWKSLARLKELDQQMQAGMEGSAEVINKLLDVVNEQNNTINQLKELIPSVPVETVVKHWEENISRSVVTEEKITTRMIEEEKIRDQKHASVKMKTRNDMKQVTSEVTMILKEQGKPVKSQVLQEELKRKGIITKNITQTIKQVMDHNPRVERVQRGYYQLR